MMKPVFDPKRGDEFLTVHDFLQGEFDALDLSKLVYSYGLLGWLHSFKITRKGISCYDMKGNYVYFRNSDKYPFYKVNFQYECTDVSGGLS